MKDSRVTKILASSFGLSLIISTFSSFLIVPAFNWFHKNTEKLGWANETNNFVNLYVNPTQKTIFLSFKKKPE